MNHPDYYRTMARYNQWMNEKIYVCCAELSDSDRKADRGAFFKSIHATLNHLLYGDRTWVGRLSGQPYHRPHLGQDLYADFAELRQARTDMDATLINWVATFTPDWLAQPFEYTSNIDKTTRLLPTWLLVTHLFNHQTHHRGQVTTLLSQMGIDPGITDLPWLPMS
ncbi:damage-inducible protein DinB [filamentous cyanobacterium CCP3]|nr:damage-inducible protein DinB [filamentous cyanobacterium CCP3]